MTKIIRLFLLTAALTLGAQSAYAQCAGPASPEGGIDYDTTIDDLIVCDGTNWNTVGYTGGGTGLFTDNTTHITRENFHILDTGQTTTTAGLDGDGNQFFYNPDKQSIRIGEITGGNTAAQDANIGIASFGMGENPLASGILSFAFGRNVNATGVFSYAFGDEASATGNLAFAVGNNTLATGENATATGYFTQADGWISNASGLLTEATGYGSYAFGRSVIAGNGTAQTDNSNTGVGNYSVAFGLGESSTATLPQLSANQSFAIFFGDQQGEDITATNVLALEGGSLLLSNDSGTACAPAKDGALRLNATSDGLEMCDGAGTTWNPLSTASAGPFEVTGAAGFEVVHNDNAQAPYATSNFVFGAPTLDDNGTDQSRMFFNKSKAAFRVGTTNDYFGYAIGSSTVWDDANVGDASIGMGIRAEASAQGSIAIGNYAISSGLESVSFGTATEATGNNSTALGIGAVASGVDSLASGKNNVASGTFSTAVGRANTASGQESTAIGESTTASGEKAFAAGNYSQATGNSTFSTANFGNASGFASSTFGYKVDVGTGTAQTTSANPNQGNYSMSFGVGDPAGTFPTITGSESVAFFFGDQTGEDITATNVLALEGGSLLLSNDSGTACAPAKNGALRLNATADGLEMCDGGTTTWVALTASASITADSLDWVDFTDTMTLDATTTIDMDTNVADFNFDANTFVIDSSANAVGFGTSTPNALAHVTIGDGTLTDPHAPGDLNNIGTLITKDFLFDGTDNESTNLMVSTNLSLSANNTDHHSGIMNHISIPATVTNDFTQDIHGSWDSVISSSGGDFDDIYVDYNKLRINTGSTVDVVAGVLNDIALRSSSNTATVYGTRNLISITDTATVTDLFGSIVGNNLDIFATATNVSGFHVDTLRGTNTYGLYIEDTLGTALSYGVYQEGSDDSNYFAGDVGIGTASTDVSALLDINSTTLGILGPRMTTAQKNAIATPATGLYVFDTDLNRYQYNSGTSGAPVWENMASGGGGAINDLSDGYTDYVTDFNLFMGDQAGASIAAGGQYNISIGQNAGDAVTTGDYNTLIGYEAGTDITTSFGVTAIGSNAGLSIQNETTAIGRNAARQSTSFESTYVGGWSGFSAIGHTNTALGHSSLSHTSGASNAAVGYRAGNGLFGTNSTANSVYFGYESGTNITSGSNNTNLGYRSGDSLTTGSANILIGYDVDTSSATASNELNIGDTLYGDLANGFMGTNTNSPVYEMDLMSRSGDPYTGIGIGAPTNTEGVYIDMFTDRGSVGTIIGDAGTLGWSLLAYNDVATSVPPSVQNNFVLAWNTPGGGFPYFNFTESGQMGIQDTTPDGSLMLDVEGRIGATHYCDEDGNNCVLATALGGGGGSINDLSDGYADYVTDDNMFLGLGAGASIAAGGQNNIALGETALNALTTGDGNIAIGKNALTAATTGTAHIAIGANALLSMTGNTENIAIGVDALRNATGTQSNLAMGFQTMYNGVNGFANTAIGALSLYNNQGGNRNVVVGYGAAYGSTGNSSQNVIIGNEAGDSISNANNNVFLGYAAGDITTTGSDNIMIGVNTDASSATASNELNIGGTIYGDLGNGFIGIGDTTPDVALDVVGDINYTGTITDVSDRRLKENIEKLSSTIMLDRLMQTDGYTFQMIDRKDKDATEYGVIAQEIEAIFPELVHTDKSEEALKSVNYIGLITPIIESIKELYGKITSIDTKVSALENENATLKSEVDVLKKQNQDIMKRLEMIEAAQ